MAVSRRSKCSEAKSALPITKVEIAKGAHRVLSILGKKAVQHYWAATFSSSSFWSQFRPWRRHLVDRCDHLDQAVLHTETAKALDLTIPETLLATADEVIQ